MTGQLGRSVSRSGGCVGASGGRVAETRCRSIINGNGFAHQERPGLTVPCRPVARTFVWATQEHATGGLDRAPGSPAVTRHPRPGALDYPQARKCLGIEDTPASVCETDARRGALSFASALSWPEGYPHARGREISNSHFGLLGRVGPMQRSRASLQSGQFPRPTRTAFTSKMPK